MLTLNQAFVKRVDELLFERNWSLYKLSKLSYVPLSTLKNVYRNHSKSPSLSIVYKVANAFDMTVMEFLNCPIFYDNNVDFM